MPMTVDNKFDKKKIIPFLNSKVEAKLLWYPIFCYLGVSYICYLYVIWRKPNLLIQEYL